ncbi:MAG: sporulation integral membrane protein YtvI [Lachnospiraceae bacterium]|nr:sporulation integral membrane protein YtvI [Lachnospiraceae bacterium]
MKTSTKYLKIFCNLLLALTVLLFIVFLLPKILVFFMPFVVGFIISLIANPMVRFLEKRIKIKRKYGTVIIIVLTIAIIVLVCYGLGMALIVGVRGFMDYLPTMYQNGVEELRQAGKGVQNILEKIPVLQELNIYELGKAAKEMVTNLMSGESEPTVQAIGGFAKNIPNMLVSVVMGFLATYFFIADRDRLIDILNEKLPKGFKNTSLRMYNEVIKVVGGYFQAQFKIMGVIYVVITIGLMLLGVNYAWLIGFGIALLDMLPVFGTGTVLIPWAVIKLFSGNFATAAGMLVLYVVALLVHQLIQPKLVGESVGLNPFATLFFMYIGYQYNGVLGMIIAIPVGMLLINSYKAGAFDTIIWCIKEIIKDFNTFRKVKF